MKTRYIITIQITRVLIRVMLVIHNHSIIQSNELTFKILIMMSMALMLMILISLIIETKI